MPECTPPAKVPDFVKIASKVHKEKSIFPNWKDHRVLCCDPIVRNHLLRTSQSECTVSGCGKYWPKMNLPLTPFKVLQQSKVGNNITIFR